MQTTKISKHGYKITNIRPDKELSYAEKQDFVNDVLKRLYEFKRINKECSL